jgi:hypothetical protein
MATSLLLHQHNEASSSLKRPSIDVIESQIANSPSPISLPSRQISPKHSPSKRQKRGRRASSLSSDDGEGEVDSGEMPEGVERDGMIWGMRVEDYRALSARERKRVRNRISARTFRAKRKGEFR